MRGISVGLGRGFALAAASLASAFGIDTAVPIAPSISRASMRRPAFIGGGKGRKTTNFTGQRNGARERARRLRQIEAGSLTAANGLVL